MRLIDADGVKDSLLTDLLMGVDGGTDASYLKTYEVIDRIENIVNEWVDNQITVKAIPIEFIERKLAEHWYVDYDIRELLADWEKENDGRNC